MIRHIVLFGFHQESKPGEIETLIADFDRLPELIPGILVYERGLNTSPEDHHQGYTHCFQLSFPDESARDAYLVHPAHLEFGETHGRHFKSVCVFDYRL